MVVLLKDGPNSKWFPVGAAPRKKKQTTLSYSNAKYTLKSPLTFNRVEKFKHKNFYFLNCSFLFLFGQAYGVCEYYPYQKNALLTCYIPTGFELYDR